MANQHPNLRLFCAGALMLAACTTKSQEKPNPLAGRVKLSLASRSTHANAATTPPDICATFTLTPYALSATGAQTLSGSPVVVQSTGPSSTPILGCVHTPGVSPDWRYVVTANNFTGCSAAIAGISPAVETFTVDVSCDPGKDVSAAVTANVSIPVTNAGGYIDIGVSVNATDVQVGCKQADIDRNGLLHFGQSSIQPIGSAIPAGYTGIGIYLTSADSNGAAPAAGTVQQFESLVHDATNTDASFTGLLALPAAPQSATLVQAFFQPCPGGQMTVQPGAAECLTTASLGGSGMVAQSAITTAQIADTFVQWPGRGAVSASVNGAQTIQLYTSLAGPHLSTLTPPVLGNDALTHTQTLSVAPANAIGLYGSLVHSDELLAIVQDTTAGAALVVLTLDETTGAWSAAAPIALSTFTTAQQQQMGLFGTGGCFPEPATACAPAVAVQAPAVQRRYTPATNALISSSGTVSASFTHADGTAIDAAHPLVTTTSDLAHVRVQWSASGLGAGEYAYAAIGLCSPYGSLSNTSGGQWIGSPCADGYGVNQPGNAFAFPSLPASGAGGVTEDLPFSIATRNYFSNSSDTQWVVPITIYVSSSATPQAGDLAVATLTTTLPLAHTHNAMTLVNIVDARQAAANTVALQGGGTNAGTGILFHLRYSPSTFEQYVPGSDYLQGQSTITLLPPAFTNGLDAVLVQGSVNTLADGSAIDLAGGGYPDIAPALQINTNLAPLTINADLLHGGIPVTTIDNLLAPSGLGGPVFEATWFLPMPTQQGTGLTYQGAIGWNGNTFAAAATDTYAFHNQLDVSPVPVADLFPYIVRPCNEPIFSGFTTEGPDTSCHSVYWWDGVYQVSALRGTSAANASNTSLLNPTYVMRLSPDEHISSSYIDSGIPSTARISISNDPACNDATFRSGAFTVPMAPHGPADWSGVRCVAIEYDGFSTSPASYPFTAALNTSITSGAPLLATHDTVFELWATADNVLPDPTDGHVWMSNTFTSHWKNTTDLNMLNYVGSTVGPGVVHTRMMLGDAVGVDVPDLTVTVTLAPGSVFDPTVTPESWFNRLPKDTSGQLATVGCTPDANPLVMRCTILPAAGEKLAAIGGWDNDRGGPYNEGPANFFDLLPRYSFIASESANGESKPISVSLSTSAAWLANQAGAGIPVNGPTISDVVIGPNEMSIDKSVHGGLTEAAPGAAVAFDISYAALGLNSGALGAGGAAIYDFFGSDFQPAGSGSDGKLAAQAQGCVTPVPVSVSYLGSTGGTATPPAPDFFYTLDAAPGTTAATVWVAMAAGPIPAGATAVKIVPVSSFGGTGLLLPIDGTGVVQVSAASASGAAGKLCNSALLTAALFNATATAEAQVTLKDPCVDPFPWPVPNKPKY
jgi:hypothetical protein